MTKAEKERLRRLEEMKVPALCEISDSTDAWRIVKCRSSDHTIYDGWRLMDWSIACSEVAFIVKWMDEHPNIWEA